MGITSIWHWLIVGVIVLVLFGGRGKISSLMGDIGRGVKSFKKGIKEEPESTSPETTSDAAKKISADVEMAEESRKDTAAKS